MTTTTTARQAIYDTFRTDWAARTPLIFDNEQDSPPIDTAWVRLAVRHQTSRQKTLNDIGQRLFIRGGVVFLQLFTPVDTGQTGMDTLIDAARPIFEGRQLIASGVDFTNAVVRELGIRDGWNAALIEFSFTYDERR